MRNTPMSAIRAFGSFFTLGALALSLPTVMGAEQKPDRGKAAERGEGWRGGGGGGAGGGGGRGGAADNGETGAGGKGGGGEGARRYVPHWRGGAPASGGGPDQGVVARIAEVPVHSRVQLDWVFEE